MSDESNLVALWSGVEISQCRVVSRRLLMMKTQVQSMVVGGLAYCQVVANNN